MEAVVDDNTIDAGLFAFSTTRTTVIERDPVDALFTVTVAE
jgi:hypothetical protein